MSEPPPSPSPPNPPEQPSVNGNNSETLPDASPPVPEGVRAQQLRLIYNKALSKAVKTCSYENFAKCFPTFAKNRAAVCRSVWEQMVTHWEKRANFEFEEILRERGVVGRLNELEELVREAEERRRSAPEGWTPVAPSMLPPMAVVEAHLTPLLQKSTEKITTKLTEVTADNERLLTQLDAQRKEMMELLEKLGVAADDMEKAVETIGNAVGSTEVFMEEMDQLPPAVPRMETEATEGQ